MFLQLLCLPTKDSVNLTKKLSEGFKRSAYRNRYQTKPAKVIEKEKTCTSYLMQHFKGLEGYLFLLILFLQMLMMKQV